MLLGIALRAAGRLDQAERHLREASDGLSRRFGSSSSEALACRLGHAVSLLSLERASEAEAEIRAVLAVYEERLGPSHPHTLVCLVDMAMRAALPGSGRTAP